MEAKSADEILGLEFDWLASDANGHVALFSTAGGGYSPAEFLRDTEAHDVAISSILALPAFTKARFAPQLGPGYLNTWQMVAERGVFAFDSDPHGGPYRMVAAPETATRVTDLPGLAAAVASLLVFPYLRFSDLPEVPDELLRQRRSM